MGISERDEDQAVRSFPQLARSWSRPQAESFLEAWRRRAPERAVWFTTVVGTATGTDPLPNPDGLAVAWKHLRERGFPREEPRGPRPGWPEWYVAHDPLTEQLTEADCWVVDGMVFFTAAVLMTQHPAAAWGIDTDRRLAVYQQPILVGFWTGDHPKPLNVLNQTLRAVHRIRRGEAGLEEWPATFLSRWADRAQLPSRPAARDDDFFDADAILSEHPDWDLEVWVPEGAEATLGTELFRTLRDRLAAIEGFSEVAWEDREVFLVRLGRPMSPEAAAAAVRAVLGQLAPE